MFGGEAAAPWWRCLDEDLSSGDLADRVQELRGPRKTARTREVIAYRTGTPTGLQKS